MNLVALPGKQPLGRDLREPNGDLPKRYVEQVYL